MTSGYSTVCICIFRKLLSTVYNDCYALIFIPWFARWYPYVVRIRIKWLTEPFLRTLFTDKTIRILIRTTGIAPTLFNLFHFYLDTDVWILILIWRRGIAALIVLHLKLSVTQTEDYRQTGTCKSVRPSQSGEGIRNTFSFVHNWFIGFFDAASDPWAYIVL